MYRLGKHGRAHSATQMHPGNHPNDLEETPSVITIDVKVNGRLIAQAVAVNESDLAEYSNYCVTACEEASPPLEVEAIQERWWIEAHLRKQTCWALVEKIAAAMRLFQNDVCEVCDGGRGNHCACTCPGGSQI